MRLLEALVFSGMILLISISSGDRVEKSFSLFIVSFLVFIVFLEVYSFPKENIPVEEDLKKLDGEGFPRRGD